MAQEDDAPLRSLAPRYGGVAPSLTAAARAAAEEAWAAFPRAAGIPSSFRRRAAQGTDRPPTTGTPPRLRSRALFLPPGRRTRRPASGRTRWPRSTPPSRRSSPPYPSCDHDATRPRCAPSRGRAPCAKGAAFPCLSDAPYAKGAAFPCLPDAPYAKGAAFPCLPDAPYAKGAAFPFLPDAPFA
jgi:hypothetical protein